LPKQQDDAFCYIYFSLQSIGGTLLSKTPQSAQKNYTT
jgi:hypothetical protein